MSVRMEISQIKEDESAQFHQFSSEMAVNKNISSRNDNEDEGDDDDNESIDFVKESDIMKQQGSKKFDGMKPQQTPNRRLSHFSSQFDFDGNDSLDKIESAVRDLYKKSGPEGPSHHDIYMLARDQFAAKREARMFRKMAAVFAFIGILMVATTFGLVFVAVKFTKDTKVNNNGQLVGTKRNEQHQNQPLSTLAAGNLAEVYVGDELTGTDIPVLENGEMETYVGTISKQNVEQVWMERQIGVETIVTNIHFDESKDDFNWVVGGNINRYHYSDRTVYTNFETSYFPGLVFSVICYKHNSDVCAITQKSKTESQNASTRRELLDLKVVGTTTPLKQKTTPARDRRGVRRLKFSDLSDDDQDQFWNDQINDDIECWMMNYELSLMVVRGHLVMVATPSSRTGRTKNDHFVTPNDCPTFSVDVAYPEEDNHRPTKVVSLVTDEVEQEYKDLGRFVFDNKLVPLIDFSKAVNEARVTQDQSGVDNNGSSPSYNVFTNNCATLILDILYQVDILNDSDYANLVAPSLIDFVTDELLMGDTFLMQVIDEMSKESWMDSMSRRLLGDRVLVRTVVKNYIDAHDSDQHSLRRRAALSGDESFLY